MHRAPHTPPDRSVSSVPRTMMHRGAGLAATLSDSAVLAGLYVTGAVVFFAQLTALDRRITSRDALAACVLAFCTTAGVYLLDRVKLCDAWLDPADAQSHPRRHAFVLRHAHVLRAFSVTLLIAASALAWWLEPWGWLLPFAAAASVLTYAGKPRGERPRPKDLLLFKNAYVALGITGFAAIIAIAAAAPGTGLRAMLDSARPSLIPLAIVAILLALRVLADAILCDIDDEPADRLFKTRTLPVRLGRTNAWNVALATRLATSGVLVIASALPLGPRLAWAAVTAISSIALRAAAPSRIRDLVDARFAFEAILVAAFVFVVRQ